MDFHWIIQAAVGDRLKNKKQVRGDYFDKPGLSWWLNWDGGNRGEKQGTLNYKKSTCERIFCHTDCMSQRMTPRILA